MSSGSPAIGALILVPIVIAASAAYIALKCAELSNRIGRYFRRLWDKYYPWSYNNNKTRRRRRDKRSDLSSTPLYADSWTDLESIPSERGYSTFINQSPRRKPLRPLSEGDERSEAYDNPGEIWHPTRSTRLMWSFTNPRSPNPRRSELSSVVRPSPAARRPERLSAEDARLLASPMRVWGHRREEIDL